ncbi:hypothetical protein PDQ75_24905 [Bacillus cereus group sp. Bc015]|uniref:hypothetical protein n=1 Tax=Bacillus cereus group sp. Bc015 TaxID=3018123 RepID=UPI0022E83E50|nr:hypothetical protein [Bacillus cereus group sp. Bc015]MDA2738396.1 hypothetical protein [Bacillus cereus group sp. Bc015]
MYQYHNVSVRLNENDYKQLQFLHDKFNRMSYGNVSMADVLRIAIKELYNTESKDMEKPVTHEKVYTPKGKEEPKEVTKEETESKE